MPSLEILVSLDIAALVTHPLAQKASDSVHLNTV
jgi:hypothetical protein